MIASVACGATPAWAQSIEISGDAAIVSDYRYRGVSYSNHGLAVQGSVDASYKAVSINAWVSTINPTAHGMAQEIDLTATLSHEVAGFDVTAAAMAYLYVGMDDSNYFELTSSIARTLKPINLMVTLAYTPQQQASGSRSNFYVSGGGTIEVGSITLSANAGHESGAFARSGKWDWRVGASREFGKLVASVSYIDTDRRVAGPTGSNLADRGLVFGLQLGF